ncbi:MAG: sigma-70 family RNA polymerase sigma factor [Bacteroidetes bacterium]|nr:sigma-70 family RNA polymerase sigma factor [Bacteroidota bacterium]
MKNLIDDIVPSEQERKASQPPASAPEPAHSGEGDIAASGLTPDRETQLFHNFLAGSDEAFRTLYDAFERSLYVYCCRILKNDTEARDLFQEIWIRMYKMRGEQIEVRRFSGLLFTVARNYCLNALRDSKSHLNLSFDDMADESELMVRTKDIENADLRELLQRALAQLPFNQREAFVLREYVGYTYDEVAEIMGTNAANARARAHRARERLRTIVSAWMDLRTTEHEH